MIIKKVTITKLAQFLTVMNGGKLVQHVENHNNCTHPIYLTNGDYAGISLNIPSDHHQMMFPYNLPEKKYQILGHSKFFRSGVYLNGNNENIELPKEFLEPEIVYYPNTNSLAIQAHPEWMDSTSKDFKILKKLILNTLKKIK